MKTVHTGVILRTRLNDPCMYRSAEQKPLNPSRCNCDEGMKLSYGYMGKFLIYRIDTMHAGMQQIALY